MRILTTLFCLFAGAAAVAAQAVEVGGRFAAGCVGSDGSMCGGGTYPLVGAHASLWAGCDAGAIQTEQTSDDGTLVHRVPELGRFREWDPDVVFVVGLTGAIRERWIVRGGWQSHRFANDGNSTQEFFMGLGHRFGSH